MARPPGYCRSLSRSCSTFRSQKPAIHGLWTSAMSNPWVLIWHGYCESIPMRTRRCVLVSSLALPY